MRVHVIARGHGWAIKKQGALKATRVYKDKDTAVKNAKKMSNAGYSVIIHKKDGTVQRWEKPKKAYGTS